MKLPPCGLYAITDYDRLTHQEILDKTREILSAGAVLLQFRNKTGEYAQLEKQAMDLKSLCVEFNVPLIVNDNLTLARTIDADGLHIGKDDADLKEARDQLGDQKIIGISCYNDIHRAHTADAKGADYIAFGSFFRTSSKDNTVKADISILRQASLGLDLPVVAVGGITTDNAYTLVEAGADYLAVISGLYQAENCFRTAEQYIQIINKKHNE
ncbi:MAG: thiamine phosphate synthase [Gammaproteobacteria bacterium]|nr:thiamine phosphate synthase [Gammaproteobacteria bacterium]NIO61610.1 thiamine phosphate synthase [Gammaproteobacteria bacterium]NIQ08594.1 thiamine phosphate synthase [Gammaproteobacteria bacterium]NIQ18861.1 thiamine phosphate synthase [Gammaproteobacteria bacterium]NIQ74317.1 thiamine phosphate synthase [Gammaproteobacteria bacterium]